MSQIPFLYRENVKEVLTAAGMAKSAGQRLAAFSKMPWSQLLNPVIGLKEGLTDPVCDLNMGETAELLAKEGSISREAQDGFALTLAPEGDRRAREAGRGDRRGARSRRTSTGSRSSTTASARTSRSRRSPS